MLSVFACVVDGASEESCGGGFACAADACEEHGVRELSGLQGVFESADEDILSDEFGEVLGAIFSCEHFVVRGGGI